MIANPGTNSLLARVAGSFLILASVLAVPAAFYWFGISPSSHSEESVGYRYFYSLRIAFGNEHPWITQGQLTTLVHVAIQRLLSALGRPPDELSSRVNEFSFLAVLIPAILVIPASWMSLSRFSHTSAIVCFCASFAALVLSDQLPGHSSWTVMPDYHVWVIPLALLCFFLGARQARLTSRETICVGLLAGVAASIKPTFALFPLAILASRYEWNGLRAAAVDGALLAFGATLTYVAIVACYFAGDLPALAQHFRLTVDFLRAPKRTLPGGSEAVWPFATTVDLLVVLLLPAASLATGFVLRSRSAILLSMLGASSLLVLAGRPYSHTLIECYAFASLEIGMLLWIVEQAEIGAWKRRALLWLGVAISLALFLRASVNEHGYLPPMIASMRLLDQKAAAWRSELNAEQKPVWLLTTGNDYRPLSVESSLCKGGMDIRNPIWGASKYIEKLFPNFHCAVVPYADVGPKVANATIGFALYPAETVHEARMRIERYFLIALPPANCSVVTGDAIHFASCR